MSRARQLVRFIMCMDTISVKNNSWLHSSILPSPHHPWPDPSCLELRISQKVEMEASQLMPVHLCSHLKALNRLALEDEADEQTWFLGCLQATELLIYLRKSMLTG